MDEDGNEDPGNEVYVGWSEGMLEVQADAEFAESVFCNEEYPTKELQQNPGKMERVMAKAFDTLLEQNPSLADLYYYLLTDTFQTLERTENTSSYYFNVDFANGSLVNEYPHDIAYEKYQTFYNSGDPKETAKKQLREDGRLGCSPQGQMPTPPERTADNTE